MRGPGGQVAAWPGGVVLTPAAAAQLLAAYRGLFRGGVAYRPWPPFLPPAEEIAAELQALEAALR